MKFLKNLSLALVIVCSALLASLSAKAEIKPDGTMVSDLCAGVVDSQDGVTDVCLGKIVGDRKHNYLFVTYRRDDGTNDTAAFPIVAILPGNSGITGKTDTFEMIILYEGDIQHKIYGTGKPGEFRSLYGDMPNGKKFRAREFYWVVNTL
ncbi:MAG: hypothetical protein IT289_10035 [Oligoflexia bacterium]|nr:hypothetical protein [Oligoflexia bacterium]